MCTFVAWLYLLQTRPWMRICATRATQCVQLFLHGIEFAMCPASDRRKCPVSPQKRVSSHPINQCGNEPFVWAWFYCSFSHYSWIMFRDRLLFYTLILCTSELAIQCSIQTHTWLNERRWEDPVKWFITGFCKNCPRRGELSLVPTRVRRNKSNLLLKLIRSERFIRMKSQ